MEGKTKTGNQKATTVWNGIRRWNRQILCVGAGLALYGAAMAGAEGGPEQEGILERREWGDGETEYQLYVQGLEEGWLPLEVEIQPRRYGEEEAEQIFETILEELPEQMRGANPSLEQVREDLELPDSFPEYGVEARWESLDPELISSFGEIRGRPEQKERARLSVELTDGVHERRETLWVQVCPLSETETERLLEALREQIRQADLQNPEEGTVRLPDQLEGKALRYRQADTDQYQLFPVLGVSAAALLYARDRKEEERKREQRNRQLQMDYAEVVYQLMVFTGAGLSVGLAWERIVRNYQERAEKQGKTRPAFEEMALAFARMQQGIPESRAIEEFGRRCGLQQYRKLSGLLEQNRRTGTRDMQKLLEQEMTEAWEQQKGLARRLGEEAGTKLLLPMFLMLAVVMVLILLPAMMSMG